MVDDDDACNKKVAFHDLICHFTKDIRATKRELVKVGFTKREDFLADKKLLNYMVNVWVEYGPVAKNFYELWPNEVDAHNILIRIMKGYGKSAGTNIILSSW